MNKSMNKSMNKHNLKKEAERHTQRKIKKCKSLYHKVILQFKKGITKFN